MPPAQVPPYWPREYSEFLATITRSRNEPDGRLSTEPLPDAMLTSLYIHPLPRNYLILSAPTERRSDVRTRRNKVICLHLYYPSAIRAKFPAQITFLFLLEIAQSYRSILEAVNASNNFHFAFFYFILQYRL